MESELQHFGQYLARWAANTKAERTDDVLRWYYGAHMHLPHPEWGPAHTVWQSWQRVDSVEQARIGEALSHGIVGALEQLCAPQCVWSRAEVDAVVELLESCRDFAPACRKDFVPRPELAAQLRRVLERSVDTLNADDRARLAFRLRQALAFNQNNSDLKDFWLTLLRGEKVNFIDLSPLYDIEGACRIGGEEPDLPAIAEGICLYANNFATKRKDRRPLLHKVWQDLARYWGRDEMDSAWNWQLIQAGISAHWELWVYETIGSGFDGVPGRQNVWFMWEEYAKILSNETLAKCEILAGTPFILVHEFVPTNYIKFFMVRAEEKRKDYMWFSSERLKGAMLDLGAEVIEAEPRNIVEDAPWPSDTPSPIVNTRVISARSSKCKSNSRLPNFEEREREIYAIVSKRAL